jgi:ankyrin repeat protein
MKKKRTSVPMAIVHTFRRDVDGLRVALAAGAEVDEPDSDGRTALHHAAIDGYVDVAGVLLKAGARADASDAHGWTPLHFAAQSQCVPFAEALLESGAKVDPVNSHGNTPLCLAVFASNGQGELIQLLRRHGADASHRNASGVSPTELAARIANYDVKQWLE